jgi:hypothetical protein
MANITKAVNPSLKQLDVLVGDWEMELSNAAFHKGPADTAKGRVSFEWLEDGAFLVERMGEKLSSAPQATWLIGRDESTPNYTALYYDSRSVSRVYQLSFSDGIWKLWREAPNFWQRFEGKLSKDGKIIKAHWEKSEDGTTWEHDFDLTYTKLK